MIFALWVVFYCSFTLFSPPLLDDADSVHAEVAREMLLRHDPVTLYANGIRYLEKAPLYYWSMAASMRVFGVSAAASRLPLALAVLALALLLESFARRVFGSARAGFYAGLITLSSFGVFIFSRINIPDVLVCLFLTAALYLFSLTEQSGNAETGPSTLVCCLCSSALALNVLTKGLIGVVFPLLIVGAFLLLTRGARGTSGWLRSAHPFASMTVFAAVAVPWHVLAALANPGHGHPGALSHAGGHWDVPYPTNGNVHGWAWFYFVNEQLYRYLNLRVPHDYDTSPLWLFLGLIFVWLMPWSAFLPAAISEALRSLGVGRARAVGAGGGLSALLLPRLRGLAPTARIDLLLLLWIALPLLFFAFSTRQEYYVLPSLPPMILLIARHLSQEPVARDTGKGWAARLRVAANGSAVLLVVGTILSLIILFFLLHTKAPAPDTDLASLLQQNPADYALSFGHFMDLNARALGLFRLPLALTGAAIFLGVLANFLLRRRGKTFAATLALAGASFVFLLAAHRGLVIFSPTLTSYQLAEIVRPQLRAQDMIVLHGEYEAGSTLGFYLRRNDLHILEGRSSNLWYGSFFPDAPAIFETRASLAARWAGTQRIFVWQDPHDPDRPVLTAAELRGPVYVITSSGGKEILSNQTDRVQETSSKW